MEKNIYNIKPMRNQEAVDNIFNDRINFPQSPSIKMNNSNLYDAREVPISTIDKNIGSTVYGQNEDVVNTFREDYNPETVDIFDELFGAGFAKNINNTYGGGFWGDMWNEFLKVNYTMVEPLVNIFRGSKNSNNPSTPTNNTQGTTQTTQGSTGAALVEASGRRQYKSLKTIKKRKK